MSEPTGERPDGGEPEPSSSGRPRPIAGGRRVEIAAAAARFFAEQGYHTVGMREIAEAVGMRGASLYNHFSAKEEVLYAIALGMTKGPVEEHLPLLDAGGTARGAAARPHSQPRRAPGGAPRRPPRTRRPDARAPGGDHRIPPVLP